MEQKVAWKSKTVWVALVAAVAAFIPGVQAWISANPDTYGSILSGVFVALRFISKDKIVIS